MFSINSRTPKQENLPTADPRRNEERNPIPTVTCCSRNIALGKISFQNDSYLEYLRYALRKKSKIPTRPFPDYLGP